MYWDTPGDQGDLAVESHHRQTSVQLLGIPLRARDCGHVRSRSGVVRRGLSASNDRPWKTRRRNTSRGTAAPGAVAGVIARTPLSRDRSTGPSLRLIGLNDDYDAVCGSVNPGESESKSLRALLSSFAGVGEYLKHQPVLAPTIRQIGSNVRGVVVTSPTVVRDLEGTVGVHETLVERVTRRLPLSHRPSTRQRRVPATSAWTAP
jgi:hypothetical protein